MLFIIFSQKKEKDTTRFLQVKTIGQERCTSFVKEKLEERGSI